MIQCWVRNFLRAVSVSSIAAIVFASPYVHGQALFQPLGGAGSQSQTLAAGTTPQGVAVADFNHDGYPDLVVANKADASLGTTGTISVYLTNGKGGFAAPTKYPTCGGPTAVLASDLDLTGLPDIVVTCNTPTSNVIEVFLNLGNGTFNPVVDGMTNIVLGTGKGPVAIVSGDFNNDGHPDLAVADSLDGTVTLFVSNPSNNFTSYTIKTLTGLGAPAGIAAGRFSTSGNLDLAVTDSAAGAVHILTGDGTGNFTVSSSPTVGTNPTGIVAGDFNHDGNTDLAVLNAGSGTVSVLNGNGSGAFAVTRTVTVGPATGTGSNYLLGMDINGDGDLDLVTGNTLQNEVAVLLGRGNGNFRAVMDVPIANGPAFVAAADFNRDGKPDLAVTQSTGATASLLINNTLPTPTQRGGLSFNAPHTLTNGHGNFADGIVAADFNHDGKQDIAATYMEDNAVRVLLGNGNGNFQTATVYPVGKQPYWIAKGDLNLDGYADLVTTNTADGTVSVLMNNGNGSGTFAAAQTYTVGRLPYQVAIGDLNGDGIPDLAVTNYGDNTVSILYGKAGGGFTGGQTLATCTNPYGVAIGDTRHSGQNDIAVTCFHTAQLEVFLNNSMQPFQAPPAQASFQSPEMYSTDVYPTSLVMADFNRDGNLDIVTGNSIANDVSFFGGNGDGTFNAGVISPSLNFPDSIAAGDVNGDGILDIVGVAPNYNQVVVTLGKGDGTFGTFSQRVEFAAGTQPWAVTLADFNNDGKLDIATANTVDRVNLTIPAYQTMYMNQFPATPRGSPSLNVLLNASGTSITLKHSPGGAVPYDSPVTLTATVAPTVGSTTPTGSVTFEDTNGTVLGSGPVALSGGTASITIPNLGSGRHVITVLYSGDTLYQPFTETGFVVRVSGTPVLATAPSTVAENTILSYSVLVGTVGAARSPVGNITLYYIPPGGSVELLAGPYAVVSNGNGTSSYSGSFLVTSPPGVYSAYAVFTPTGGGPRAGSSSTITVTVTP